MSIGGILSTRLLFLGVLRSIRFLLVASIFAALSGVQYDVWNTPLKEKQERIPAGQVLHEQGVPCCSCLVSISIPGITWQLELVCGAKWPLETIQSKLRALFW